VQEVNNAAGSLRSFPDVEAREGGGSVSNPTEF
jgi:hypothetical protein